MPGITGRGETFALPNYTGALFQLTPTDTPLLSRIGGLTGGIETTSTRFGWQFTDTREGSHRRQRTEGADAPEAQSRARSNESNVVEIHQETVDLSYTKMAATGQIAALGSNHPHIAGDGGTNPVNDEFANQMNEAIKAKALDVEHTFIYGELEEPANNSSPRRTGGLLEAITSNVVELGSVVGNATVDAAGLFTLAGHGLTAGQIVVLRALGDDAAKDAVIAEQWYYVVPGDANTFSLARTEGGAAIAFPGAAGSTTADVVVPAPLTKTVVDDVLTSAYNNGGMSETETATVMAGIEMRRALTKIYVTDANYQEQARDVGGVRVSEIMTPVGMLQVMTNRHLPKSAVLPLSFEDLVPRFLRIPDKGHFFWEPLAKTGASERSQLYGEIGLQWGNERKHAKIVGAVMPAGA